MRSFWIFVIFVFQVSLLAHAETTTEIYGANIPVQDSHLLVLESEPQLYPGLKNKLYAGFVSQDLTTCKPREKAGLESETHQFLFRKSSLDDVRGALLETRSYMRTLQLDQASEAYKRTQALFSRLESPWLYQDIHIESLALKTELSLITNNAEEAIRTARLWARLKSNEELHPGLYSPNLIQIYNEARTLNIGSSQGYVLVNPRTTNAKDPIEIYLNHQKLDSTTEEMALSEGTHYISIRQADRLTFSQEINIRANEVVRLRPFLSVENADMLRRTQLIQLRDSWTNSKATKDNEHHARISAHFSSLAQLTGSSSIVWLTKTDVFVWKANHGLLLVQPFATSQLQTPTGHLQLVDSVVATLRTLDAQQSIGRDQQTSKRTGTTSLSPDEATARTPYLWVVVPSFIVGAGLFVGVTVAIGTAAALSYEAQNAEQPAQPPRTVVVTCCGRGVLR